MATTVLNVQSLEEFKAAHKTSILNIFTSKKGNKYAKLPSGKFIGMLADDLVKDEPIIVFDMKDDDTGEQWLFIANGTPKEPEFTI